MTREKDVEQLQFMAADAGTRKVLEIVLRIAQADIDSLNEKLLRSSDFADMRAYQGGIKALQKLTSLNGSVERGLKPVTSED